MEYVAGFATALGSFVAQNFAAGRMDRARHAYRYTLMTMMALGLVVTASFMLFGSEIFAVLSPKRQPTSPVAIISSSLAYLNSS